MLDQAAEYASVWTTFEQLSRPADHRRDWATWATGRRRHRLLAALIEDQPAVVQSIAAIQRAFTPIAGFEPHPARYLHLSIQSFGFDDQCSPDLPRLASVLIQTPRFDVELGGVNAFQSALFLEVHSGGRLLALRKAIRAAQSSCLTAIDPFPGLLFHVTLGYLDPTADVDELRAAIRPLRRHATGRLTLDRVALIDLPTDQREAYPALEPVRCLALGPRR